MRLRRWLCILYIPVPKHTHKKSEILRLFGLENHDFDIYMYKDHTEIKDF